MRQSGTIQVPSFPAKEAKMIATFCSFMLGMLAMRLLTLDEPARSVRYILAGGAFAFVMMMGFFSGCDGEYRPYPAKITVDRVEYKVWTRAWCDEVQWSCYINYRTNAYLVNPSGQNTAGLDFKRGNLLRGEFTPLWIFQSEEGGEYLVATDRYGYAVIVHSPLDG